MIDEAFERGVRAHKGYPKTWSPESHICNYDGIERLSKIEHGSSSTCVSYINIVASRGIVRACVMHLVYHNAAADEPSSQCSLPKMRNAFWFLATRSNA